MAPKTLDVVPVEPPPPAWRVRRSAEFPGAGGKPNRYTLPAGLESNSPVGYRVRVPLTRTEIAQAVALLSMARPTAFGPGTPVPERELFEECSLGVLTSRQSTNFRGHRAVVFGPQDSARLAHLLRSLVHREAEPLDGATHTHVVLARPYRTPFTLLLTFAGHKPVLSLATVVLRAWRKRFQHVDDIPSIGYLQHLHVGILADTMERAAVLASGGRRRAQVFVAPFCGIGRTDNKPVLHALEEMCGLTLQDRAQGWKVAIVGQVGSAAPGEAIAIEPAVARKVAANLLAFRSERIQPGVNAEEKAPAAYQQRQPMDVPDALTVQAGRAAYNAFSHWTGVPRERAKDLLLLDRIDVLTPNGKERLRAVRERLQTITDNVVRDLPLWADLPTGRAFSTNAARGRKAFALVGQRIYIVGLAPRDVERAGLDWTRAVRATGAAAARATLYAELMGVVDLPADCDLLCGCCLMAGPVNQNDIGKQFYGGRDLLAETYPDRDPTALLVWTLKAKTVADPIGNEEQLLNPARKGALVDLRPAPHDVVQLRLGRGLVPMRRRDGRANVERAFGDIGNFAVAPDGGEIPGNRGSAWPAAWADAPVWSDAG
ncbi:MAG: hypothetical protein EXR79_05555 [Myxococcales bacterium]|nr:hypothetical protein [Myxococcales bacterium]